MRVVKAGLLLGVLIGCQDPGKPHQDHRQDCAGVLLEAQERRILRFTPEGEPLPELPCPRPFCICGNANQLATYDEAGQLHVAFLNGEGITIPGAFCPRAHFGSGGVMAVGRRNRLTLYADDGAFRGESVDVPLAEGEGIVGITRVKEAVWVTVTGCAPDEGTLPSVRQIVLRGDPSPYRLDVRDRGGRVVGHFHEDGAGRARLTLGEREVELPALAPPLELAGGFFDGEWVYATVGEHTTLAVPPRSRPFLFQQRPGSAVAMTEAGPFRIGKDGSTSRIVEGGSETLWERVPGRDLTGAPLPNGARVEQVKMSHWRTKLAFLERIRLQTCEVEDRVHLVEAGTTAFKTLRSGKGMRSHAVWGDGTLHVVEADVEPRFFSLRDE